MLSTRLSVDVITVDSAHFPAPPPPSVLLLLFRLQDKLSILTNATPLIALDHQLYKEFPPAIRRTVLARRVVQNPRRLPAPLSSTHPLPRCLTHASQIATGADVLVNEVAVSLADINTLAMVPFVTASIACYHPCMIVAFATDAEDLAIRIG